MHSVVGLIFAGVVFGGGAVFFENLGARVLCCFGLSLSAASLLVLESGADKAGLVAMAAGVFLLMEAVGILFVLNESRSAEFGKRIK